MKNCKVKVPQTVNEPVYSYEVGSNHRQLLKDAIKKIKSDKIEIPLIIGGKEYQTDNKVEIRSPHDHTELLGYYYKDRKSVV